MKEAVKNLLYFKYINLIVLKCLQFNIYCATLKVGG